jgi:hypothetical protein
VGRLLFCLLLGGAPDGEPVRRPDASWSDIFAGPFATSRVFAMPTAEVVGPYQLSLSGEGSLLSETGALSASGVAALGFGDLAQLEYRASAAVSTLQREPVVLPTLGVQFKVPLPRRPWLPTFGLALRMGLAHEERGPDGTDYEEKATDLYLVTSVHLWGWLRPVTIHLGVRIAGASIEATPPGGAAQESAETLALPAGAWEWQLAPRARLAGELALVPVLDPLTRTFDYRPFGRLGVRWQIFAPFIFDASMGYRIEVARLAQGTGGGLTEFVNWDIRLGGEVFVPWGAISCRVLRLFCQ